MTGLDTEARGKVRWTGAVAVRRGLGGGDRTAPLRADALDNAVPVACTV